MGLFPHSWSCPLMMIPGPCKATAKISLGMWRGPRWAGHVSSPEPAGHARLRDAATQERPRELRALTADPPGLRWVGERASSFFQPLGTLGLEGISPPSCTSPWSTFLWNSSCLQGHRSGLGMFVCLFSLVLWLFQSPVPLGSWLCFQERRGLSRPACPRRV